MPVPEPPLIRDVHRDPGVLSIPHPDPDLDSDPNSLESTLRPLAVQQVLMSKIIQALKTRQHALLESPTGQTPPCATTHLLIALPYAGCFPTIISSADQPLGCHSKLPILLLHNRLSPRPP